MRKLRLLPLFVLALLAWNAQAQTAAPAPATGTAKPIKKDEPYFAIARRLNAMNESPVSAIIAELDGVIEVTTITMRPDGKAEVTVKERASSNASSTQKSTRVLFAPPPTGEKWTWVEFEENRRFYPVEKLFPYAKDELTKRKQLTDAKWNAFVTAIVKQGEAAAKTLDTAKAILKGDPPPLPPLVAARNALNEGMKDKNTDNILGAYENLNQLIDPISTLADQFSDLKANDAYLRLLDEFKNSINVTKAARRDYVQTIEMYNEALVRLPFALAAYGLQFTKIEPKLSAE